MKLFKLYNLYVHLRTVMLYVGEPESGASMSGTHHWVGKGAGLTVGNG